MLSSVRICRTEVGLNDVDGVVGNVGGSVLLTTTEDTNGALSNRLLPNSACDIPRRQNGMLAFRLVST